MHKFILAREEDFYHTRMRELYDLRSDPDELNNIADEEPDAARDLDARLEGWIAEMMSRNGLTEDPLVAHGITLGKAWKEPHGPASGGLASRVRSVKDEV
jgi:arylsulfatase A-like enzyme